jgi:hypothetical protein
MSMSLLRASLVFRSVHDTEDSLVPAIVASCRPRGSMRDGQR